MEIDQITSLVSIFSFGQQIMAAAAAAASSSSSSSKKEELQEAEEKEAKEAKEADSDTESDTSSDSGHSSDDHDNLSSDDKKELEEEELDLDDSGVVLTQLTQSPRSTTAKPLKESLQCSSEVQQEQQQLATSPCLKVSSA